jgi:hypothetical protein
MRVTVLVKQIAKVRADLEARTMTTADQELAEARRFYESLPTSALLTLIKAMQTRDHAGLPWDTMLDLDLPDEFKKLLHDSLVAGRWVGPPDPPEPPRLANVGAAVEAAKPPDPEPAAPVPNQRPDRIPIRFPLARGVLGIPESAWRKIYVR